MNKERFAQAVLAQKENFYRIAYSYVKNEQDALDIVSEATYKGLKSLHTLKSPEYFDTWMTRIVINTAADFLRKASRTVNLEEDALDIIPAPEADLKPEDSLDLFRAMDSLQEKDRACITLRYFEEYSFLKIAQILQEPESTVKSRLYRALRKMRQALN